MNRYYIVLMNSMSQTYITGEFTTEKFITCKEDLDFVKDTALKNVSMKNDETWLVLSWKKFEEE